MDYAWSTMLFAKAYGIYFVVVGLALLFNPQRFRRWYEVLLSEDWRPLFGAVIALLIGSFIIAAHNLWVADWRVLITLIGYWGVVKGAGLLIVPGFANFFRPMASSSDLVYRGSGLFWAIIGVILFYHGFMV